MAPKGTKVKASKKVSASSAGVSAPSSPTGVKKSIGKFAESLSPRRELKRRDSDFDVDRLIEKKLSPYFEQHEIDGLQLISVRDIITFLLFFKFSLVH